MLDKNGTISVINHSNAVLLRQCLRSLSSTNWDITVIDNATDGRLVLEIQAEFPDIKWFFNDRPLGFSANHNQVLRRSKTRYTCILNDDTIIHDGCFERLVACLNANPKVAIVGPRVRNPDGTIQNSTFRDKTLRSELIGSLQLPGRANRLKRGSIDPAQFGDAIADVDWLLGACLVVRTKAMQDFGLLDEKLAPIANTEDEDWCYRARQAGYRVVFVPQAEITHLGGQSQKTESAKTDRFRVEMMRTRINYFRKHHGRMAAMLLRLIYIGTLPWNWIMLTQARLRHRMDGDTWRGRVRTLGEIARMSLHPNKWSFAPLPQNNARQTIGHICSSCQRMPDGSSAKC